MSVGAFYDGLAPLYHLVYEDWDASVARQGAALASLIDEVWGAQARSVLDAAVGVGTQALGLLARGFRVIGSDLSPGAVDRARHEAARRHAPLVSMVADFRALPVRSSSVDVVLVCDNALPHLETETDIRTALGEWWRCARPGGIAAMRRPRSRRWPIGYGSTIRGSRMIRRRFAPWPPPWPPPPIIPPIAIWVVPIMPFKTPSDASFIIEVTIPDEDVIPMFFAYSVMAAMVIP